MRTDTLTAVKLLSDNYTCVFCKGDLVYKFTDRGVQPLLSLLNNKTDLKGFCAADSIVGKAAAFLYFLLGVEEVYADVMSESAIYTLAYYGIQPICNTSVKHIINRTHTGICPMEETVLDIDSPNKAYEALKNIVIGGAASKV